MLELSVVREEKDKVVKGLLKKGYKDAQKDVEALVTADQQRREIQQQADKVLQEANAKSKEIGKLMGQGKKEEAEAAKADSIALKAKSGELKKELDTVEEQVLQLLYKLPNLPHESVPEGTNENDNEVISEHGTIADLPENAQPHWELIEKYDIIDFELGNKITGAGFPVYKGKGAKLQRALVNFFLDEAEKAGYNEVQPPIVVNEASGLATGQLPDKEGQMYEIGEMNYFLIPTAEVPITNMYRGVILKEEEIPVKNVGFTPCFRKEAGSWGADVRGLNRLHQFDKVEIVQIQHPSQSYQALETMKAHVEGLIAKLELPYRVLRLCGGDLGFTAALTYDMEVYSAAQKRWLEVSSVSNFETYQANRLKLRFRGEDKKTQLLHTLNGSALALPRIMAAIIENNQTEEGIVIPEALRPYTRFDIIN